jgi:hypothetical protein
MEPDHLVIGWREWLSLPDLGVPAIKAKVDSGARSSCLHVRELETFFRGEQEWVRFVVQPLNRRPDIQFACEARVVDRRRVTDSGGHSQQRVFISTTIKLGDRLWPCEINLTKRDNMLFPMLLGRTSMANRALVQPGASYRQGRVLARAYDDYIIGTSI